MIVYQETKKQFLYDVRLDLIEEKIEKKVQERLHKKTAYNEFLSWMNSMQYMYKVMKYKGIPEDSKIAIEYRIPILTNVLILLSVAKMIKVEKVL